MRQEQGEWKVTMGNTMLANLGSNANEARMAMSALRYYRFTEQRRIREPVPLSYCLAGPQSPHTTLFGMQGDSFFPEKLKVEQTLDGYALVNGTHILLRFGAKQEEAQKVLEVIQQNKLDQLSCVGDPGREPMLFFVRTR
jgi:hypothetical protein